METDYISLSEEALETGQMSAFEHGWPTIGYDDLGVDAEHPDYHDEQLLRRLMEETGSDQAYDEEYLEEVIIKSLHQDWDDLASPEMDEMFFEWMDWRSMVEHMIGTRYKFVQTENNGAWYALKR